MFVNSRRLSRIGTVLFFLVVVCVLFIPSSSTGITEPIRDGDYIYIDDNKAYLKGTYSTTHGQNIEHWAMTKQFTGDCDMAIGFNSEVAWPTKVLLDDPHYEYYNIDDSKTFYYVINFAPTVDNQDYGNWYNPLKYIFDHKILIGYDTVTNEPIWQDIIGTVVYFDSQVNDGINYTVTWHTEHSRLEQYRDISHQILADPIEYEFDGKNLWFITKNIPMTANEMRKIIIEMDGKIELGEQSYKYDIIWKPSHQTIPEAKAAGNLYVLDPYFNLSWGWRRFITYNQSAINGTYSNISLQFYFNFDNLNDNGTDIRLTYENGTQMPREIEFYNSTSNNGSMFFAANTSDTGFWLYGGNPSATEPAVDSAYGSQAVWNSGYKTMQLMHKDPSGNAPQQTDSTSNGINGTAYGTMTSSDLELVNYGYGIAHDGVNDYTHYGDTVMVSGNNAFTVSARIYSDAYVPAGYDGLIDLKHDTEGYATYIAEIAGTTYLISGFRGINGARWTLTWNEWNNNYKDIDIIYKGGDKNTLSNYALYVDGEEYTTGKVLFGVGSSSTYNFISADSNGTGGWSKLTFVQWSIFDGELSSAKIQTKHNNINNPTAIGIAPFYDDIGVLQYGVNSLHYNITDPYNHTIRSDGTITSNRSIVIADDIDDTALSVGVSYLQITLFNNSAYIVRNFTITGDNLDWYQAANLVGSYNLKNSSGIIETSSNGNFTTDLKPGDYWIESSGAPIITLLSQTPSIICQNCTGNVRIVYGITTDSSGLNNTSVSCIYRNYDPLCACSNHSIRPPTNNLATEWDVDGRILRAANRNESLNFEDNATITSGNTYSWSGLDENSSRLSIEVVNSTYYRVYINGTVHDVMPQMWYLDRSDLQEAPKTTVSIYKNHNVLVKFWEFELFKGNTDFLGVGYTDTVLNSNPTLWPSDADPVRVYYVNDSYDPATGGDPLTSGFAVYMLSLNASEWIDHVYEPHTNSSYVRGFINNNLLEQYINTTNISYILYVSETPPSKAFQINVTDVVSSTNVSFANTGVLWTGDTTYTSEPYTPNIWFSFMKDNITFDHMLYVADNNDKWTNSTLNSTVIGAGFFPPTKPSFYAFHNGFQDFDMNGTYHDTIQVQVSASSDPDGGPLVPHNLTLHYDNRTLVATINGSAVAEDGVYTNISFNTTPYYSQTELYTLRVIATDDENETTTVWLGVNFSLDGSPRIICYSPETPVLSTQRYVQTFTIDTNLLGNVTWYIDGVEVFNETFVNTSSYSNHTAPIGFYNVTVVTTNVNGTNSMKWDWEVEDPIYAALTQIQLDINKMKKTQTIIQALIFLVIGVIVGIMAQRRRNDYEDMKENDRYK